MFLLSSWPDLKEKEAYAGGDYPYEQAEHRNISPWCSSTLPPRTPTTVTSNKRSCVRTAHAGVYGGAKAWYMNQLSRAVVAHGWKRATRFHECKTKRVQPRPNYNYISLKILLDFESMTQRLIESPKDLIGLATNYSLAIRVPSTKGKSNIGTFRWGNLGENVPGFSHASKQGKVWHVRNPVAGLLSLVRPIPMVQETVVDLMNGSLQSRSWERYGRICQLQSWAYAYVVEDLSDIVHRAAVGGHGLWKAWQVFVQCCTNANQPPWGKSIRGEPGWGKLGKNWDKSRHVTCLEVDFHGLCADLGWVIQVIGVGVGIDMHGLDSHFQSMWQGLAISFGIRIWGSGGFLVNKLDSRAPIIYCPCRATGVYAGCQVPVVPTDGPSSPVTEVMRLSFDDCRRKGTTNFRRLSILIDAGGAFNDWSQWRDVLAARAHIEDLAALGACSQLLAAPEIPFFQQQPNFERNFFRHPQTAKSHLYASIVAAKQTPIASSLFANQPPFICRARHDQHERRTGSHLQPRTCSQRSCATPRGQGHGF